MRRTDLPPHWVYVTFETGEETLKWVITDADKREARKIIHDAWNDANQANGGGYTLAGYHLWPDNYRQETRTLIARGHCTRYRDRETEAAIACLDALARNREADRAGFAPKHAERFLPRQERSGSRSRLIQFSTEGML